MRLLLMSKIKHEAHLNELDSGVGDSDCGSTLSTMAKLFLDQIQSSRKSVQCAGAGAKCCRFNPYFVQTNRAWSAAVAGDTC